MKISKLAAATDVTVPTIKYYLREGLLHPGRALNSTQADYDDTHVRRLRLIRSLTGVAGLSVQQVKAVLTVLDEPVTDLFEALGTAVAQLPPSTDARDPGADHPRARAVIERLGQHYDPEFPAVAQLERALIGVEDAGIPLSDERLAVYAEHLGQIARYDLTRTPEDPADALEYAVLGTALYEPVLLALRRLAHRQAAAARFGDADR